MQIRETQLPGCYELLPKVFEDDRGRFVKTFHTELFSDYQLETEFREEYYSVSHRNVLRGLHFQLPPQHHTKVVYCVQGQVRDVVVDLRVGSPTYGQFQTFELGAEQGNLIYIPPGLAHGFYTLSETAIMVYKVSTVYSPAHDSGIHWNSLEIPWGCTDPVISQRDSTFPTFDEFVSPFVFSSAAKTSSPEVVRSAMTAS